MSEEQEEGQRGMRKRSLRRQSPRHEGLIDYGRELGFVLTEMGLRVHCRQCREMKRGLLPRCPPNTILLNAG